MLDYKIMLQNPDTFVWELLYDNVMSQNYVVTGLVSGQSYTFAIKARNIVGVSTTSQALSLVAS